MKQIIAWIKKNSIWDILAWIAYVYFIVYLFLFVTGKLNSPLVVDVFGVASAAYFLGTKFQKLDATARDTSKLKEDFGELKGNLGELKTDLGEIKIRFDEHLKRFEHHIQNKNAHK